MVEKLLPYYSNTHSNADMGILMKNLIMNTRNLIRTTFNLNSEQIILFTGNGSTGAVNHLKNSMNFNIFTNIFISKYEHYSNHLPWYELSRHNTLVKIFILDDNFQNLKIEPDKLTIISLNICSNVTGETIDISYFQKFRNTDVKVFIDMACYAPYNPSINLSNIGACFMSGHKFFGGIGCPGILIANKSLFNNDCPAQPGGSCVKKADSHTIIYSDDLETRESAGTPNIIGIIKFGYVLELKTKLLPIIIERETNILNILKLWCDNSLKKYPELIIIGNYKNKTLPILSFSYGKYHPNLIVKLLNDLFGIQSRGGISCCGLLGEQYRNQGINGWCRISLSWHMSYSTIKNILLAIEFILQYIDKLQSLYIFDSNTNLYTYKKIEIQL
jgi:selenocysteine lyase/cysteine desulfurase